MAVDSPTGGVSSFAKRNKLLVGVAAAGGGILLLAKKGGSGGGVYGNPPDQAAAVLVPADAGASEASDMQSQILSDYGNLLDSLGGQVADTTQNAQDNAASTAQDAIENPPPPSAGATPPAAPPTPAPPAPAAPPPPAPAPSGGATGGQANPPSSGGIPQGSGAPSLPSGWSAGAPSGFPYWWAGGGCVGEHVTGTGNDAYGHYVVHDILFKNRVRQIWHHYQSGKKSGQWVNISSWTV